MTPEDLVAVERSWSELRTLRAPLLAALTRRFDEVPPPAMVVVR